MCLFYKNPFVPFPRVFFPVHLTKWSVIGVGLSMNFQWKKEYKLKNKYDTQITVLWFGSWVALASQFLSRLTVLVVAVIALVQSIAMHWSICNKSHFQFVAINLAVGCDISAIEINGKRLYDWKKKKSYRKHHDNNYILSIAKSKNKINDSMLVHGKYLSHIRFIAGTSNRTRTRYITANEY